MVRDGLNLLKLKVCAMTLPDELLELMYDEDPPDTQPTPLPPHPPDPCPPCGRG